MSDKTLTAPSDVQEIEYSQGEKILAYHQSLIYEAKVLKVSTRTSENSDIKKTVYLIHYQGWNDRWDEWVDASRMLKYTEENKKLQEEIKAEYKRVAPSKKRNGEGSKSKKRKLTQEKVIDNKFKIEVPSALKKKLIDDWEFITYQKYLTSVPRRPSVVEILQSFQIHLQENKTVIPKLDTLLAEFKTYFDKALGIFLLYRFERHQYGEILKYQQDKRLSEIYGFEHLLRLCVKFPQILSTVEIDEELLQLVKTFITELLKYFASNITKFSSLQAYEPATPQYIRLAT